MGMQINPRQGWCGVAQFPSLRRRFSPRSSFQLAQAILCHSYLKSYMMSCNTTHPRCLLMSVRNPQASAFPCLPDFFISFYCSAGMQAMFSYRWIPVVSPTSKVCGSYWRHQSRNARISHELHRSGQGLIVWNKFLLDQHRRGSRSTSLVKWRGKASSFWLSEPTSLRAQMLVSSPGTGLASLVTSFIISN